MSNLFPVIVGASAGGLALIVIIIAFIGFCTLRLRILANKNSETGSSDPPAQAEWNMGGRVSSAAPRPQTEPHEARQFVLTELEHATKNFSDSNLVGEGSFGLVYKGLLCDGTVVAIKRRQGSPQPEFVNEVHRLTEIRHRNLVNFIGYCQEGGWQMLVSEYMPNGSVSGHLYDSTTTLEFKQRLAVAIGAAKGLSHLHGLVPPLVHKGFKTSKVLVDENFIAKVADAGISRLIQRIVVAGPSQTPGGNVFRDPEVGEVGVMSEASDVYSFGVFLLELISGQEAARLALTNVEARMVSDDLIDPRFSGNSTSEGMKKLLRLTLQCLSSPGFRRPKMASVVIELDQILETEMTLTTVMGDGTAIVTLGSQLFTSTS